MIIQTLEKNENYFLVFCITIFLVKAQNKIRQSRDQCDLFINDANSKGKKTLNKFTSVTGGTKGFFSKNKKTTNKHII